MGCRSGDCGQARLRIRVMVLLAEGGLGPGGLDGLLAHVRQGTVAAAVKEELGDAVGHAFHGADGARGEAFGDEQQGAFIEGAADGRVGGPVDFGDAPGGLLAGCLEGRAGTTAPSSPQVHHRSASRSWSIPASSHRLAKADSSSGSLDASCFCSPRMSRGNGASSGKTIQRAR